MTDDDLWRAADGAIAPLRRYVRLALESDETDLDLKVGNARRMLARALQRPLPGVVSERLDALAKLGDAGGWLDRAAAELARIEVLGGLGGGSPRPPREVRAEKAAEPRPAPAVKPPRRAPKPAPEPSAAKRRPEPEPEPADEGGDDGRDWGMSLRDAEVGAPEVLDALEAAGVVTVRDVALLRPVGPPVTAPVWPAGSHGADGLGAYSGRLGAAHRVFSPSAPPRAGALLTSDAGVLLVRWHGARPEAEPAPRAVVVGTRVGGAVLDAELVHTDDNEVRLASWGVPGVADAAIRGILRELEPMLQSVAEPLPRSVLEPLRLPSLGSALTDAHVARSEPARRRLALEELIVAQLGVAAVTDQRSRDRGIAHAISHAASARWAMERDIDDAQQLVLEDVKRDLRRAVPTRRVLCGDAGADVAVIAAATVAEGKTQVLFLLSSPAEAEQRFLAVEPFLRDCGLVARVATSPVGRAQADALKRGEVHVLFGTHDLLEQGLEFRRLGLIVASERPPYGRAVAAHEALAAPRPDLLVLPATAVGPTVLLSAYADLRVSMVGEGALPPTVRTLRASQRADAVAAVRAAIGAGRQALVVRPLHNDVDALDARDAAAWVDGLRAEGLAERIGLLHGQQPRDVRAQAHDDLLHRRVDVLASTTLAEEGPPLGDVRVVLVEEAERLDRARLHRLAVAVASGQGGAEILLLRGGDEGAPALDLAPLDAPDDVHAEVKWPLPRLDWFEPKKDVALLLRAREEAQRLVQADPQARRSPYWQEVAARWSRVFPQSEERGIACPVRDDAAGESKRRRRRRRRRR